jgi:hypothetical protein
MIHLYNTDDNQIHRRQVRNAIIDAEHRSMLMIVDYSPIDIANDNKFLLTNKRNRFARLIPI